MTDNQEKASAKTRKAIYETDRLFYLHQDKLLWSRLRIIILLETLWLFARSQTILLLPPYLLTLFDWLMFLLILGLSLLSMKDSDDAKRHLLRLRQFEETFPLPKSSWPKFLPGMRIWKIMLILLALFNLSLLFGR